MLLLSELFFFFWNLCMLHGEGNGTPLQYSCLENPMDGGAWWAAVHGVLKSWNWLSDFTFNFHFHSLEKEMATHSSVLAWRILGTGEPGRLPPVGSHRVGHDWSNLVAAACMLHAYTKVIFQDTTILLLMLFRSSVFSLMFLPSAMSWIDGCVLKTPAINLFFLVSPFNSISTMWCLFLCNTVLYLKLWCICIFHLCCSVA